MRKPVFKEGFWGRIFTGRQLWRLIWPLVIEQLLNVLLGMVDTTMVSGLGEAAVSAVSLVDMINVLVFQIFAAMSTGGAVVVSQKLGAGDREEANRTASQLMTVSLLLSLGLMVLCLVLKVQILRLFFGAVADDVMAHCITVFVISAFSYPFIALYDAAAALFRCMNNSRVSMFSSAVVNVFNLVGNAVLIHGVHMGVAGSALATSLSRVLSAVILLSLLCRPDLDNVIHINLRRLRDFVPQIARFKAILRIGVPSALENSMFQLGRILVVSIIAGFGTVQVAANAVANNLDGLGCIPGQAISLAMVTVVGRCVGAGDEGQVKLYTKRLMQIAFLGTFLVCGAILLAMPLLLQMYNLEGAAYQLAAVLVLIHDGCAIVLWPPSFVLPNALRATNDVRFPMVISIFSMCAFRILLSYVIALHMGWGAIGVWLAMIVDWVFRALLFSGRYLSGAWKRYAGLPARAAERQGDGNR